MKQHLPLIIFVITLLIISVILIKMYQKNKEFERLCFELPRTGDSSVFGPHYWAAFHKLAHNVPCSICRGFAEKFIVFFHDTVNKKLGKPIYDQENFSYFTRLFADMDRGVNVFSKDYVQA